MAAAKKYQMLEWTSERVSGFWDYWSQFPQTYFTYQFGDVMVRRLEKYLKGRRAILDYGCGTGFMIQHLLDRGYGVTGLDFSKASVQSVSDRFKGKPGFAGAYFVDDLLAKKEQFDAIVVFEVIEHLSDEYLASMAANLKTLLKPDGVLIVSTPNEERLEDSHMFCPGCNSVFHQWQHIRTWSAGSISAFFASQGFAVKDAFSTDFTVSFRKNPRAALRLRLRTLLGKGTRNPHLICVCSLPGGKG